MQRYELFNPLSFFNEYDSFFSPNVTENSWSPPTLIKEAETHFHLALDIPGVNKEHLNVSVKEDVLNIKGERKDKFKNTDGEYDTLLSFEKSYTLPKNVNATEIEVSHDNGVLDVVIPKVSVEVETKAIEIKSGSGSLLQKLLG